MKIDDSLNGSFQFRVDCFGIIQVYSLTPQKKAFYKPQKQKNAETLFFASQYGFFSFYNTFTKDCFSYFYLRDFRTCIVLSLIFISILLESICK